MTMLEFMLAILLFTIFTAAFLSAVELVSKLMQGVDGGTRASGIALSRTVMRQRLNVLAGELSSLNSVAPFVGNSNCLQEQPARNWNLPVRRISASPPSWAMKDKQLVSFNVLSGSSGGIEKGSFERVCLYPLTSFAESTTQPGLYILQAEPMKTGPLVQPIRVLVCRPDYLCRP